MFHWRWVTRAPAAVATVQRWCPKRRAQAWQEQLTEKHMNIFWNKHEQIGYGMLADIFENSMLANIFENSMSATFIMHIHADEQFWYDMFGDPHQTLGYQRNATNRESPANNGI